MSFAACSIGERRSGDPVLSVRITGMLSVNSRRVVLLILLLFFLPWRNALPGAAQQPSTRYGAIDDARLAQSQKEPQNWPIYNGGWYEHRYSFLDQINVDNVSRLKSAWFVEFDTTRGQESTPLVVDGVMYVSTAWSKVFFFKQKTAYEIWRYDPKVPGSTGVNACLSLIHI